MWLFSDMGVLWVIIVAFGICFQALVLNSQNLTCDSNDLKALQEFRGILESAIDGWSSNSSYNCCEWPGITCNAGRVVKLELGKGKLIGRVSPSVGTLDRLMTLNLTHNMLKGSLPVSLFALRYLEILDLSSNQLSGPLPSSIDLPALKYLDISQNLLNGSLPASICENTTISVLNVAENQFFGDLPPELGNCTALQVLSLGMNGFSGGISEAIFKLQNLTQLSLQGNKLSGPLSEGIGSLTGLVQFDISSNQFTGKIPDVFHGFEKLKDFVAHSNKFTGGLPRSLTNSSTLSLLSLRNNSLGGHIELNCSAMTDLMGLDLGSNRFIGPIPEYLPSCLRLNTVNLARNNFSSQIPESFRNFHSLSHLSLSNASLYNLSSSLNTLQWCRNLSTLILTLNFRNEEFPADPSLHFENLKVLVIANCRLTGSIPPWLRSSGDLQLLDLSWNRLEGTIPMWFGSFESLFYVDLSNNSFTGEIPKGIAGLPSLTNQNISLVEEPSPEFPLFSKKNASTIGLQYNQVLSFPPTIDLSYNNLRGPIWPEFGKLEKLLILDLKFNHLSGPIPSTLSGMLSLEVLDLSHNDLSGQIPNSLENLSFLSTLNVAYNHLYGPIPAKGQFLTFPNSSFEGNDLCGDHIFSCLPVIRVPTNSTRSRRNRATIVGLAVGIVFGFFSLFLILMILLRGNVRSEVDPEKEEPEGYNEEAEESESRLVVMFQTKENNKVLCLEDLLKSTNNFDQANIVGCGGFGLVYRAILPDGRKVAIKRLSGDCQVDREFRAEVEALSRAQHPNLVYLQGYCMYKNDRLLIYSYMENSSLDYWLHENLDSPSLLDWDKRLQIAQGAARGLAYLHQSCEPHILHRDIKSSNILLDENFEAHLADFGLARLMLPYDTHVTTDLVGTLGYIPPEYGQAPVATYKGDVYSFGVVLLELVTGKRPMDICKPRGARDLISWVFQMKNENRETEVFDPLVYEKANDKEMTRVLDIACLCLSESPKVRPSTQQIVSWLNNIKANM